MCAGPHPTPSCSARGQRRSSVQSAGQHGSPARSSSGTRRWRLLAVTSCCPCSPGTAHACGPGGSWVCGPPRAGPTPSPWFGRSRPRRQPSPSPSRRCSSRWRVAVTSVGCWTGSATMLSTTSPSAPGWTPAETWRDSRSRPHTSWAGLRPTARSRRCSPWSSGDPYCSPRSPTAPPRVGVRTSGRR